METIKIQGHRGQRSVQVIRKRRFLSTPTECVSTPAAVVETIAPQKPKPVRQEVQPHIEALDLEVGLAASFDQYSEGNPRRKHRRERRDLDEDYTGSKQPYRRDKGWRK